MVLFSTIVCKAFGEIVPPSRFIKTIKYFFSLLHNRLIINCRYKLNKLKFGLEPTSKYKYKVCLQLQ